MDLQLKANKIRTYQNGRAYRVVGRRAFPYFKTDYKNYVEELRKQMPKVENNDTIHTAYTCEITIYFKIPKTYTNTIKKREEWAKNNEIKALNNIDTDNIAKTILDLLEEQGYIINDKNITDLIIRKRWQDYIGVEQDYNLIYINIIKNKAKKYQKPTK